MSHTCKALVIHCMDFRFHTAIRDYLLSLHLEDAYDVVSLAGASKGLAQHADEEQILLKQVALSSQLHKISDVFLIHHMDCGAYGGHTAFANIEDEKKKQVEDLSASKKEIQIAHPTLTIHSILAHINEKDSSNTIRFEEI